MTQIASQNESMEKVSCKWDNGKVFKIKEKGDFEKIANNTNAIPK